MKTRRTQVRTDNDYTCTISMEFEEIDTRSELEKPVDGVLKISLSESVPHPVEIGIEDNDGEADASYAEFPARTVVVETLDSYPVTFPFTAESSMDKGGKWYYYRTADWNSESDLDPVEDPEFVRHHTPGIPSAQRIRIIHRILEGDTGEETIQDLKDLYQMDRDEVASEFSDDIKKFVGFETRTKVQDFLIGHTSMHRTHSNSVNKVAKQIVKEEYRHRATSLERVEEMVKVVNQQENFPSITLEEVFQKVMERSNEDELKEIADHIGIQDWSVIFAR